MAILAPAVFKISHALYEHENIECVDINSEHAHQTELDCDFQKFKFSHQTYPTFVNYSFPEFFEPYTIGVVEYTFLSKYKKLHFSLRGPPATSLS